MVGIFCLLCFWVYAYLFSHRRKGGFLIGLLSGNMLVDSILIFVSTIHLYFFDADNYYRMGIKLISLIFIGALVKMGLVFYLYTDFSGIDKANAEINSDEILPKREVFGQILKIYGKAFLGLFSPKSFFKAILKNLSKPPKDKDI